MTRITRAAMMVISWPRDRRGGFGSSALRAIAL